MTLWQIVLAILVVVVFLLYLVAIPLAKQRAMKKQAAIVDRMHANLKLGDQIVLIDGIVGTLGDWIKKTCALKLLSTPSLMLNVWGLLA